MDVEKTVKWRAGKKAVLGFDNDLYQNKNISEYYGLIRAGTKWDSYVKIFILRVFPFVSDFGVPSILCLVA
jgi:hypothetical protein